MSTAIAVLLCKHKCSVARLASKMAFHPPSPPSYTLETQADGSLKLQFSHREMTEALRHYARRTGIRVDLKLLRTSRRQSIPLFHFIVPGAQLTLLWSHSNAMDCGEMYFFFMELAMRLKVNVAAYDYSGCAPAPAFGSVVFSCDGRPACRLFRVRHPRSSPLTYRAFRRRQTAHRPVNPPSRTRMRTRSLSTII